MPEIAEIARVVHFLRQHVTKKTILNVLAQEDAIVYGKVGTTAVQFAEALKGRHVLDVGQRGKYFWLVMDKPPHPVMHFGMTGWIQLSTVETGYYRVPPKDVEWPPRFWKFILTMDDDGQTEVAFTDPRRLGRIRLVDAPASELLQTTPLKENGPDPVLEKDIFTEGWLSERLLRKKVPIKAFLLDQSIISGIGNWVGDEVLYHSRIHPEQYSNTLSAEQIGALYKSIGYVCDTAVSVLADSSQFPSHWLMRYRWSKGKKSGSSLPNGQKITFVTVGGRTSAVVLDVQKKPHTSTSTVTPQEDLTAKPERVPRASKNHTPANPKVKLSKRKAEGAETVETSEASSGSISQPLRRSARLKARYG